MFEEEAEEFFKNKPVGYEMKPEKEIYIDGFNDGYNKANEWHYVKDGDLPKNGEKNILLYCKEHFCTTSYVTVGYFEEDVFYNDCDMEEDVIAWKEIVLPKEIKEND